MEVPVTMREFGDGHERGIWARQLGGLSGAIAARSVGGLALDSYGPRDGQVLSGLASASAAITALLW